jgi:hypothetical protein
MFDFHVPVRLQGFKEANARVLPANKDQTRPGEDFHRKWTEFVIALDPLHRIDVRLLTRNRPRRVTLHVLPIKKRRHSRTDVLLVEEPIPRSEEIGLVGS